MNEEDCGLLHSINHGVLGMYKTNWEWDEFNKQQDFTTDWSWETQWCFSLNILNLRGQQKKLGFKEHNCLKWPLLFFLVDPFGLHNYLSKPTESSEMPWDFCQVARPFPPGNAHGISLWNPKQRCWQNDNLKAIKVGRVMSHEVLSPNMQTSPDPAVVDSALASLHRDDSKTYGIIHPSEIRRFSGGSTH